MNTYDLLYHHREFGEADLEQEARVRCESLPPTCRHQFVQGFKAGFRAYEPETQQYPHCPEEAAVIEFDRTVAHRQDPVAASNTLMQYIKLAWLFGFTSGYRWAPEFNRMHQNLLDFQAYDEQIMA